MRSPRRHGRWKTGYACRCWNRKCDAYGSRVTRRLHPDHYHGANKRYGNCRCCGRSLSVDWYRTSGSEKRANMCKNSTCAYPFPHRKGSLYCIHYKGPESALANGMFGHYFEEVA